jgi:hypothetical protein
VQLWSFDTETWPIQKGRNPIPKMVCATWAGQDGSEGISKSITPILDRLYTDDDTVFVGHNIAFDFGVAIRKAWEEHRDEDLVDRVFQLYEEGRVIDTITVDKLIMLASGRFEYDFVEKRVPGYTMDQVVWRWFHQDISEDKHGSDSWRMRYWMLEDTPLENWPSEALRYALDDPKWTLAILEAQAASPLLPKRSLVEDEVESAWNAHLAGAWGMRADPGKVLEAASVIRNAYQKWVLKCQSYGFRRTDGKKNIAAMQAVIEERLGDSARRTPSGGVGTSYDDLVAANHEGLDAVATSNKYEKMAGTYVPILERASEYAVAPRVDSLKKTGRTSYSNPPLQQLPRGNKNYPESKLLRRAFTARRGYVYLGADYSTIELRALAQVCLHMFGKSAMADALLDGKDLHVLLATDLLSLQDGVAYDYEHILEQYKAEVPRIEEARQFCKVGNFGFPGGQGPKSFMDYAYSMAGIRISLQEAKTLRDIWMRRWPEMKLYFAEMSRALGGRRHATIEQLYSGRIRARCTFTEGNNTRFQGLAADGAKEAMRRIMRAQYTDRKSPLWRSRTTLFMHDEFILEVPKAPRYNEQAAELQRHMIEGMARFIPDIPIKAVPAVTLSWVKDAKPTFDDGGNLIVTPA